ncbi:uncharacterized protein C8Q71DRAFT_725455 [Rhodofomes roseus]|uniref:MYND-type domain-containing protein n=1 Tax=Rhodofomes roseus TaxID=34475 RepID=A0ABQ8K8T4_9APHY|nr:uncharacterized protein C8Q71DRAFT_725455 [Rhodofomes roseus]KAH9833668.1 hypothetical protein C8Q71DRAFT_725455 [Rhodofomes roseus]
MPGTCAHCQGPATRQCKGCVASTAWYCTADCQKIHWPEHRFECAPTRELTTADELARAVYRRRAPDDDDTLQQYGFAYLWTHQGDTLFQVYISVLSDTGVPAKRLHQWRVSGRLFDELKTELGRHPGEPHQYLYTWLLQNPWIFDNEAVMRPDFLIFRPHKTPIIEYVGLPKWYTDEHLKNANMSKLWQQCFSLHVQVLADLDHRARIFGHHDEWVVFGFAACITEDVEAELLAVYDMLMWDCTFEEYYTAYRSASLLALFDAKGLGDSIREFDCLEDLLSTSPSAIRLVYFLKQSVLWDNVPLRPDVAKYFGFVNCRTTEERAQLKSLYKRLFVEVLVDPVHLHLAAARGKLYDVACLLVAMSDTEGTLFHRLLKEECPSSVAEHLLFARYTEGVDMTASGNLS